MKTLLSLAISVALASVLLAAPEADNFTWKDQAGNPSPETESMKSKNGLGAQFLMTANQQLYADWAKPEMPRIETLESARINQIILPVVLFVNPKRDNDGKINVTYDLKITRPDGTIAQEIPNIPAGTGLFNAPQFNLQLARAEVKWKAEEGDPLGVWRWDVVITDHNRDTSIPLSTSIMITQ